MLSQVFMFTLICFTSLFICTCALPLISAEPATTTTYINTSFSTISPTKNVFEPFTGRIRRNKVRMRIQADVNSPIVSELPQSALIAVVGEQDDFYAVRPAEKTKVYVYRTYVLNHTVDACRINVRLQPSIDAPVVGQLHQGERVEGKPSTVDDQWIEIDLPDCLSFYVAKEFIEKAGPASFLNTLQARREEALEWIALGQQAARKALESPHPAQYSEMDLTHAYSYFNKVTTQCKDFPDLIARAQQARQLLEEELQRKQRLIASSPPSLPPNMPESMTFWIPREQCLFDTWHATNPQKDITAFYASEKTQAIPLKGIIQPYTRTVQNKPGNFMLIHPTENCPVAFLYSTQVDLQQHVGNTLSLLAVPRPNYNFAFPAYFILSIL